MYKIKEILVFENQHKMSFIEGMVVEGPRGGIYLFDRFCLEQWVEHAYGKEASNDIFWRALSRGKIGKCNVEVSKLNDFITPLKYENCTEFRRLEGIKKLKHLNIIGNMELL